MSTKTIITIALCLLLYVEAHAQCPDPPECVGSSLVFDGNNQYVDILTTPSLQTIAQQGELTFEAWIKPSGRNGFVQPVAGVWGPRADRDDQWLIEIDSTGMLLFMVSNGATNLGA